MRNCIWLPPMVVMLICLVSDSCAGAGSGGADAAAAADDVDSASI
jgi:hypothetical protein